MTDLYKMTWQKKNDKDDLIHIGPILRHLESNPYWGKETTPYTHREALNAAKRWNRIGSQYKHNIIKVPEEI